MEFNIGDRVRVAKSAAADYVGLEGVIVARQPDNDSIFNSYTVKTDEGEMYDFLEFQLERAKRFDETAGAPIKP